MDVEVRDDEVAELMAENERLRAENGRLWSDRYDVENERLRAALKPFAEWVQFHDNGEWQDSDEVTDSITYGDFRRACNVLT
jgi:hypothetical protein